MPLTADIAAAVGRKPNPWAPPALAEGGPLVWVGANLIVAACYFALAGVVSQFFAAYGLFPAPIWLPTGIAFVGAMAGQLRMFPGIFLGSFLANAILFAPPLHITTIISISNAAGPVIGAMVMRRLRPDSGLFTNFYGVVAFVFCSTFLSPAIIATGGTVALVLGDPLDWTRLYSIWVNWWLADSGGSLYLAPALTLWLRLEHEAEFQAAHKRHTALRHNLAVWAWIAAVSLALFLTPPLQGTYIRSAFPFLLVVPLSWIALRMSLRSAYSLVTLVAIAATAGTVAGYGPFQNQSLANPLQLVGTLVVLLAMNVLTIVALVGERHEAETQNQVKSMFLATTSHELRAPLNAIIGFSTIIDNPSLVPAAERDPGKYARLIRSSGEHLLALINDLLEMSKIEAGRFELTEAPVSLRRIVAESMELILMQAEAKKVAVAAADVPAELTVRADAKALRQILLNLLSNAVKFTPAGGRVTIAAALGRQGELELRVADTGVGIPADALERVFAPFERAHKDKVEGTGLGLAIARALVMLHGGTIGLESTLGHGTTAIVTLPASRTADAATPPPPNPQARAAS
ncbi:MAG: MASE1 domain-containing protein [Proteobacteria bacterium]|nr:MASE1 domain-containing protein [Pseudomonadota bacterium]MBI3499996.1 MASE1 domain-containing protein [Pseudomonadota bacterium]